MSKFEIIGCVLMAIPIIMAFWITKDRQKWYDNSMGLVDGPRSFLANPNQIILWQIS